MKIAFLIMGSIISVVILAAMLSVNRAASVADHKIALMREKEEKGHGN